MFATSFFNPLKHRQVDSSLLLKTRIETLIDLSCTLRVKVIAVEKQQIDDRNTVRDTADIYLAQQNYMRQLFDQIQQNEIECIHLFICAIKSQYGYYSPDCIEDPVKWVKERIYEADKITSSLLFDYKKDTLAEALIELAQRIVPEDLNNIISIDDLLNHIFPTCYVKQNVPSLQSPAAPK